MTEAKLEPSQAHLASWGPFFVGGDGSMNGESETRPRDFWHQDTVAHRGAASTIRANPPARSRYAGCVWLARGREKRIADSLGEQGFAALPGFRACVAWSQSHAPLTGTKKNPSDSGRSAIYRCGYRPHIRQSRSWWHRGVKIHAALTMMSCRQGARSRQAEEKS